MLSLFILFESKIKKQQYFNTNKTQTCHPERSKRHGVAVLRSRNFFERIARRNRGGAAYGGDEGIHERSPLALQRQILLFSNSKNLNPTLMQEHAFSPSQRVRTPPPSGDGEGAGGVGGALRDGAEQQDLKSYSKNILFSIHQTNPVEFLGSWSLGNLRELLFRKTQKS